MKKEEGLKKYFSALLILVTLIIALFLFSFLQLPNQKANIKSITGYTINIEECNYLTSDRAQELCRGSIIVSKAMFTKNVNLCEGLENEEEKSICRDSVLLIQSFESKDKSICNNIISQEIKDSCLNST
jgi:hypothetical protein